MKVLYKFLLDFFRLYFLKCMWAYEVITGEGNWTFGLLPKCAFISLILIGIQCVF